jgi:PBP1b-binding outer membrane lipoprotein LpoB
MMRVIFALAATLLVASCSNEAAPITEQSLELPNDADIVPGAGLLPLPPEPPAPLAPPDAPPTIP